MLKQANRPNVRGCHDVIGITEQARNAWAKEIYAKLLRAARAMANGQRHDVQHDAVVDVICLALEKIDAKDNGPWREYFWLRVILKHKLSDLMRIKGKFNIEFTSRQIDSLETALKNATTPANQEQRLELNALIFRLENLSEVTASCVSHQALGFTTEEIAEIHGLLPQAVSSRLNYARALLKKEGYFDDDHRVKPSKYYGVFRTGMHKNPWKAQAVVDGRTILIGTYKTTTEAAVAYDDFVKGSQLKRKTNGLV